ncbi:diguanylate cyclase domain-containing protein [Neobacillus sp. PS2-9]|uniref:sensor domain-containing diguanylate cyclase n=1 Tax=Neobacillus sp. PS2-9 TaxID=3070676 RepID=UPI0027E102A1|nr:diguanylate cyclase [Neobacillus sp. PS2-9]WML58758.1 diguanylate cyclase [Neobacillus sp. PS2-9]
MMSFYHEVIDTSLITVVALFFTFYIKNKFLDKISPNNKHQNEFEKNYLDTLKDLQDLKFALDESNLVQIVDKSANILYANEKFCRLSEYSFEELKGKNMRILNSSYHSKEFIRDLWTTVTQGKVWSGEIRNKTKSGTYYWTSTTIVPFLDKNNKPFQYIVIRNDITKSKELEKKLEYLSNVDGLTSLFNRRYFDKMLDYYWQSLYKSKNSLSVILFDVDYFKCYNDHYGHLLGDQCLIDISNRVKDIMNSYEAICARYGGEEFAIILPKKDAHEARFLAERIRQEVEQLNIPHEWSKINNSVTMSFGVASLIPTKDKNPLELLELADKALYQAKNNGRNTVA